MQSWSRPIYVALGLGSLVLGFIGVFLPLLPTTPFILLAAFFFARGSEAWHQWLLHHKIFGPIIRDWECNGVIRPHVKVIAISMLAVTLGYALVFKDIPIAGKIAAGTVGLAVAAFILSRPSSVQSR